MSLIPPVPPGIWDEENDDISYPCVCYCSVHCEFYIAETGTPFYDKHSVCDLTLPLRQEEIVELLNTFTMEQRGYLMDLKTKGKP